MRFLDARNSRPTGTRPQQRAALLPTALSAIVLVVAPTATSRAVEPAEEFLHGLQERGLSELALEYLERIESSQIVDDQFRREVPYHRGVVLIEQSRQTADPAARTRLLDEARAQLERFAKNNPENVQAAEAHLQLGSIELSRGQQLIAQAAQLPREAAYDAQRQSLGKQARELFAVARETFVQAEAAYSAELARLPPTATSGNGGSANHRQEYRARVAQLRFLAAQTQFETAQSYAPEAPEYRQLHQAAAKQLATVYDEFARTFIVGLYARLYEGRCYQALGQHQQALGSFEDILAQPNVLPPFRRLIASAIHRKAEILIAQESYDAAIATANACLRDASASEEKLPEWLAVRFRLAEALERKGHALAADSLDQRRLLAEARDAYRLVANTPGEFQAAARTAAVALARGSQPERNQPRSFQAAYDAGKDALASYNAAKLALAAAERNNPAALPELEAQMRQGKQDARRFFRAATTLVDDDTDLKSLNEVRYFLSWLYWDSEDFYRSAVLGEFIARRYPDHPASASAAKIAMASFERLYSQAAAAGADAADTDFEARRMARVAEFITRRWPGTDDAEAAQGVLVSYAIRTNRIEEAERLVAEASPQSRPQLELQLGNAMWVRYLELSQPSQDARAEDAAVARVKGSAVKFLRSGWERVRGEGQVSELAATAGLYLAQALLSDEKFGEVIQVLEEPQVGPLVIISRKHPAASPQYAVEAYKAALRAYVLVTPPQGQKALDMMQSLEEAVGSGDQSEAQLTQIYIGLGVALQQQIEQLRDAGREQDVARITSAFAEFLDRIAARQADANWPTRVWLAQTYYQMGVPSERVQRAGPSTAPPDTATDAARRYLEQARDAFRQLLNDADKNPNLAPDGNSILAVKMQLGECYRELGQFQQALDTFSEILKEKESSLAVQRAAAYAYQQRGQAEGPQWLERAIHGGYKLRSSGENRIWGWIKISHVAARAARADEKYRDTFYEARVNIARCRYLAAMKQSGAAREQDLAKAKQSIQSLAQLYPDLGGQRWRGEVDALLKQIQTAAGERPNGLSEFSAGQSPQNDVRQRRG